MDSFSLNFFRRLILERIMPDKRVEITRKGHDIVFLKEQINSKSQARTLRSEPRFVLSSRNLKREKIWNLAPVFQCLDRRRIVRNEREGERETES